MNMKLMGRGTRMEILRMALHESFRGEALYDSRSRKIDSHADLQIRLCNVTTQ